MPAFDLKQNLEQLRQLFFKLQNDPPLLAELRQLGLGLLVCLAVAYGAHSLLIEPQQRKIDKQLATLQQLRSTALGEITPILDAGRQQLNKEILLIREEKAVLELKKNFLSEQWKSWSDEELFTRLIMTLDPAAPVSLEGRFKKLNHLEPQIREDFIVHPLRLTGVANFQELLAYLRYLEERPEIGTIDDLVIERVPVEGYERAGKITFGLTVGRVTPELREAK